MNFIKLAINLFSLLMFFSFGKHAWQLASDLISSGSYVGYGIYASGFMIFALLIASTINVLKDLK